MLHDEGQLKDERTHLHPRTVYKNTIHNANCRGIYVTSKKKSLPPTMFARSVVTRLLILPTRSLVSDFSSAVAVSSELMLDALLS